MTFGIFLLELHIKDNTISMQKIITGNIINIVIIIAIQIQYLCVSAHTIALL